MMRLVMLPVVGLVHVLDGVLADVDRYLVHRLHEELRATRGPDRAINKRTGNRQPATGNRQSSGPRP